MMNDSLDYGTINPGVRRLVRLLRMAGFRTVDSGDGVTNVEMEDFRPYPHVVLRTEIRRLVDESRRLLDFLQHCGVRFPEEEQVAGEASPTIQANFDPVNGVALIDLSHVSDSMLAIERADVPMRFLCFSRSVIEKMEPYPRPHILLSLGDPADPALPFFPCSEHTMGVFRTCFHDIEDMEVSEERALFIQDPDLAKGLFAKAHAEGLADFVLEYRGLVDTVLVHCEAGVSRSPAVAAAFDKALVGHDAVWFQRYAPNTRVYRVLTEVLQERLGGAKEEAP